MKVVNVFKRAKEYRQALKECLSGLPHSGLQVSVDIERGYKLVAVVTTPSFEGMDEVDRQAQVWQQVIDHFGADSNLEIDFIFTNTPAEEKEIERLG